MIDMFAKILFLIVITAVVCAPIDQADEDIPVYTEKVVKGKPTKPGGTRVPRFHSKKLSSLSKKTTPAPSYDDAGEPYPIPDTTSAPEKDLKTAKPSRPYRRAHDYPKNVIVDDGYQPRRKPALRGEYNAPRPSYAEVPQFGVEYAPEVLQNTYQPPAKLVDEYKPRKRVVNHYNDYDAAVGNAPQMNYAQAPKEIALPVENNYGYANNEYDNQPQPYVFGFELHDENGATQNRKEQGDGYGNKRGSYGYKDENGVYRQVDYIADAHGFRAIIKTNEPGTENQNPADVEIHSEAAKY